MISSTDKDKILEIAKAYGVKKVLLFGSSVSSDSDAHDIDLAVDGICPNDFYSFYGDLIFSLSKPVDVVDMADNSKFIRMINREGVTLYVSVLLTASFFR